MRKTEPHQVDEQLQPQNEPSHPTALEEAALQLVPGLEFKGYHTWISLDDVK